MNRIAIAVALSISAAALSEAAAPWTPTGSMANLRLHHAATSLSNGKVLVTGGTGPLSSAELYDPVSGTWSPTGPLNTPRYRHIAVLLSNGKVLAAGGYGTDNALLASAELYDPVTGVWIPTGSMATARGYHSSTLLPNGKVLVAGGYSSAGADATAELYDPSTGVWTPTNSMAGGRSVHTATLLPNGKLLVAGGVRGTGVLTSAEIYDPATALWVPTGSMSGRRYSHTATLLPNGRVLTTGGNNNSTAVATAELYNPATGTWAPAGPLANARFIHTAVLLNDGKVLAAGGLGAGILASSELYDPALNTWAPAGAMGFARYTHSSTLLGNGQVLVAGGGQPSAELYGDGEADAIPPTASPAPSPAPNGAGWNNSNVTVTWNWADNAGGSGIDAANCTSSSVSAGEGSVPLTASCKDLAGNTGNASFTVKVDKTAPVISAIATKGDGTPYTSGVWTNQNVTVHFECSDAGGSALASCSSDQVLTANAETSVSGTAADNASNGTTSAFVLVRIDKAAPTIAASAKKADGTPYAPGTWSNQTVTVHFTCGDTGGSGALPCPADQVLSADGTTNSVSGSVTDNSGNSASASFGPIQVDKTAPVLNPVVNPNPVMLNGAATVVSGASDALSGLASQSCGALQTSSAGTKTVTCTAADNAGNSASKTATYSVGYTFSGFLAPVSPAPAVNRGKAGRTIPLKWRLRDGSGASISALDAIAAIVYKSTACGSPFAADPAGALPASATGGTGLRYDGQYLFNWDTPRQAGCYTLFLRLSSGQAIPAYFNLE